MFDGFEELPYRGFAGLLWAQRVYSRADTELDGLIGVDEFMSILDNPRFNPELLKLIDGLVMPTQEEIEDVALKRLGRPANEADYLINFIQKSQKSGKKSLLKMKKKSHSRNGLRFSEIVQDDPAFDDPPRNIIFRLFDSTSNEEMKYGQFAQFIKYSWLFQSYDPKRKGIINDVSFW